MPQALETEDAYFNPKTLNQTDPKMGRMSLGFKQGKPDWSLLPLENLLRMPAVQWKLLNIQKLIKQNPDKHAEQLKDLEDRLI